MHTPGPWKRSTNGRGNHIVPTDTFRVGPLAIVTLRNDAREQEANARLIAAAPKLLEAAQGILSWCGYLGGPEIAKLAEAVYDAMPPVELDNDESDYFKLESSNIVHTRSKHEPNFALCGAIYDYRAMKGVQWQAIPRRKAIPLEEVPHGASECQSCNRIGV